MHNANNSSADNGGLRHDTGKPRIDLVPTDALRALAEVYTKSCSPCEEYPEGKYPARNWERGMLFSRCYNSLMRHAIAWQDGEDHDAESGLHHMAHVAWNAFAILSYHIRGIGQDDRPSRPVPESRIDTIHRLLREEFDIPAFGLAGIERSDLNYWANKLGILKTENDVAQQNQEAAGVTYKAIELYDSGVRTEDTNGQIIPIPQGWVVGNLPITRDYEAGDFILLSTGGAAKISKVHQANAGAPTVYDIESLDGMTGSMIHKRAIACLLMPAPESKSASYRCIHCHNDATERHGLCGECAKEVDGA